MEIENHETESLQSVIGEDKRGEPLSELPPGGSTPSDFIIIINMYKNSRFILSISPL
jgi:hypothetical protein